MSNINDFVIKNGVLKKYVGKGGKVIIPEGITEIGSEAFRGCTKLTQLTIPDSVTKIGLHAFSDCIGLTQITIPDKVTEIEQGTFEGCSELDHVTIPDSVIKILDYAFSYCTKLTQFSIPDSVTYIGSFAFANCTELTQITIPDGVTIIGHGAFQFCTRLAHIIIPNSVTYIGNFAFTECSFDKIFVLGDTQNLYNSALEKCNCIVAPKISVDILKKLKLLFHATLGFLEHRELYEDEEIINTYENYAFTNKKKILTEVLKKDLVCAIDFYANARKIKISNFEQEFFAPAQNAKAMQCVSYLLDWKNKNISFDDEEKYFEKQLNKDSYNAGDMKKLWSHGRNEDGTIYIKKYKGEETDVVIPEKIGRKYVTKIGSYAFLDCTALASIEIPDSITSIDSCAFKGCTSLTSIVIPDSVASIEWSAFTKCTSLTSITIPDGVTSIESGTFLGCTSLTSIVIPDGVTSIESGTFLGCTSLTSIVIPDSVTSIGDSVFAECDNLTILASSGSYAEAYAKENNIPFVAE